MKKVMFLISVVFALFAVSATVEAQTTFSKTAFNPTGLITNTGVDTGTVTVVNPYTVHGIQLRATKTSGTIAGTAVLYGSIDGVAFVPTGDTITLANMTAETANIKSAIVTKTNPVYLKYRWITTGSGTVAMTISQSITGRKLF